MRLLRPFALLLLTLVLLAPLPAEAAGAHRDLALAALSWIAAQQSPDGGFAGYSASATADAVLAICAAGGDPNGFLSAGNSPISFLAGRAAELAAGPGSAAKTVLALACAGHDPRTFAGRDWVALLEGSADPATGHYGFDLTGHAFSILALESTGRPIPSAAGEWLRRAQGPAGGWAWTGDPAADADTNSTALAVQALAAAGAAPSDPALQAALAYLHGQQNADGGFPYAKPSPYGSATDANSTAYVVQALVAAGQDPEGAAWTVNGQTPLTALWRLQLPGGALEWQPGYGADAMATYQAVPAFMLAAFPLARITVGEPPALLPATGAPAPAAPGALPAGLALWAALAVALGLGLRRLAHAPLR